MEPRMEHLSERELSPYYLLRVYRGSTAVRLMACCACAEITEWSGNEKSASVLLDAAFSNNLALTQLVYAFVRITECDEDDEVLEGEWGPIEEQDLYDEFVRRDATFGPWVRNENTGNLVQIGIITKPEAHHE